MQTKNPIANPIVVLRKEFDDWAVLFNPDTAEAVGVNPVGVAIWELLDGKNSLEDIAANAPAGATILVGTHAGPIAAATRWAGGIASDRSVFASGLGPITNTGITTLRWPGPRLVRFNDIRHTAGPGSRHR